MRDKVAGWKEQIAFMQLHLALIAIIQSSRLSSHLSLSLSLSLPHHFSRSRCLFHHVHTVISPLSSFSSICVCDVTVKRAARKRPAVQISFQWDREREKEREETGNKSSTARLVTLLVSLCITLLTSSRPRCTSIHFISLQFNLFRFISLYFISIDQVLLTSTVSENERASHTYHSRDSRKDEGERNNVDRWKEWKHHLYDLTPMSAQKTLYRCKTGRRELMCTWSDG